MKNILRLLISLIFLVACEGGSENTDYGDLVNGNTQPSVILSIGDYISFDYDEIHLYDSSSHVLIFEDIHPEFEKLKDVSFGICANGETIYQGNFWPSYLSSVPDGVYISNYPFLLQNYALKIDYRSNNNNKDPRNDPRFINSLRDRNLLHSGLAVKISKIESNGSFISFSFTVTNMDKTELLILDPDETGLDLFHYFTNGLVIRNLSNGSVTNATIPPKTPVSLNGFQSAWLTSLSPGTTKSYTFLYSLNSRLNPGEYLVSFVFPGLTSQVDILNLYQKGARIWLGNVAVSASLTVQ